MSQPDLRQHRLGWSIYGMSVRVSSVGWYARHARAHLETRRESGTWRGAYLEDLLTLTERFEEIFERGRRLFWQLVTQERELRASLQARHLDGGLLTEEENREVVELVHERWGEIDVAAYLDVRREYEDLVNREGDELPWSPHDLS